MPDFTRTAAVAAAVSLAAAVLAACGSASSSGASASQSQSDWRRLGGSKGGLSISVPPGWLSLDRENVDQALPGLGLDQNSGRTLRLAVFTNATLDGVFIVDPSSGGHTFVDASCLGPGPDNSSEDQEKQLEITKLALQSSGAENIEVSPAAVGGQSGLRASYVLRTADGTLTGQQYGFAHDGFVCAVKMVAAAPEKYEEVFRQIAESIRAEA